MSWLFPFRFKPKPKIIPVKITPATDTTALEKSLQNDIDALTFAKKRAPKVDKSEVALDKKINFSEIYDRAKIPSIKYTAERLLEYLHEVKDFSPDAQHKATVAMFIFDGNADNSLSGCVEDAKSKILALKKVIDEDKKIVAQAADEARHNIEVQDAYLKQVTAMLDKEMLSIQVQLAEVKREVDGKRAAAIKKFDLLKNTSVQREIELSNKIKTLQSLEQTVNRNADGKR
jgi:hypothetical protein